MSRYPTKHTNTQRKPDVKQLHNNIDRNTRTQPHTYKDNVKNAKQYIPFSGHAYTHFWFAKIHNVNVL